MAMVPVMTWSLMCQPCLPSLAIPTTQLWQSLKVCIEMDGNRQSHFLIQRLSPNRYSNKAHPICLLSGEWFAQNHFALVTSWFVRHNVHEPLSETQKSQWNVALTYLLMLQGGERGTCMVPYIRAAASSLAYHDNCSVFQLLRRRSSSATEKPLNELALHV